MATTSLLTTLLSSLPIISAPTYCTVDTGCQVSKTPVVVTSSYAKTKYPIVLAHGFAAFSKIGASSSWYGIPDDLTSVGAQVYVTKNSSIQSSDIRGEQLLKQAQNISAISGSKKLNFIAHSQGGQSIRYVAGVMPSIVASLTGIGSSTIGKQMYDDLLANQTSTTPLVFGFANALGQVINILDQGSLNNTYTQDFNGYLNSSSVKGVEAFNARFPLGVPMVKCGEGDAFKNGIYMFSWGGTSIKTNALDPSDLLLAQTGATFDGPSDGLASQCGNHFGKVIRDNYEMNHLDEINQVNGLVGKVEPKALYREHANRLKKLGL